LTPCEQVVDIAKRPDVNSLRGRTGK